MALTEEERKEIQQQMSGYWQSRFESSKRELAKLQAHQELEKQVQSGRYVSTEQKPQYAKIPISQPVRNLPGMPFPMPLPPSQRQTDLSKPSVNLTPIPPQLRPGQSLPPNIQKLIQRR